MPSIAYNGDTYTCTTALKGADYIHLLDANGNLTTAFDGVTNMAAFVISDGSWTTPTAPDECFLAVIGDDGSIKKGSHKCSDVSKVLYGTETPEAYCTAHSITPTAGMVYFRVTT